jgi:hypothetical protein
LNFKFRDLPGVQANVEELLFPALVAVAADFGASSGDFDRAIFFDLLFKLFVNFGFKFADGAALQAGDVDVVARTVAFIKMLVAAQVQKIEFVDQAVALQQVERAINGDAMNARIDFHGAVEDRAGVEVALGAVHDLENNSALAREADAAFGEGFLKAAGTRVGVDAFAGGDSMCGGGHLTIFTVLS